MTVTDGVTLFVGLLAALVGFLSMRGQRRLALDAAARKQQDDLATKQEEVTAEQIKAEDAEAQRLSEDIWELVRQLRARCDDQDRRYEAMERRLEEKDRRIDTLDDLVADLKADLAQVRIAERQVRAENTALRNQLAVKDRQIADLHLRLDAVEKRTEGQA